MTAGWDYPNPKNDAAVAEVISWWEEHPHVVASARSGLLGATVGIRVDLDDARHHDATQIPPLGESSDTYSVIDVDAILVQFAHQTARVRELLPVTAVTVHVVYSRYKAPDEFDRYLTLSAGTLAELAKVGANVDIFFY